MLEFLIMLPVMIALTVLIVRVNTAIQTSIVNQQYARAQALFLAFHSPIYPELRLRIPFFDGAGSNQMVIGVSENPSTRNNNGSNVYKPKAAEQLVARKEGGGSSEAHAQPSQRSRVRIRTTVALCTQLNVVSSKGTFTPLNLVSGSLLGGYTSGSSYLVTMPEGISGPSFSYCRGSI